MSSEARPFLDVSSLNFLFVFPVFFSMFSFFLFCMNMFGLKSLFEWKVLL